MCLDPVSAAAISGVFSSATASVGSFLTTYAAPLQIAGAGFGAVSSYQSAQAQKSAAKYESAVASANAKTAEFAAQDAQDRGIREAEALGIQQNALRARQRATMAANGLDLASGTPQAVQDTADFYGLQDIETTANNANREAWSLKSRGQNFRTDAAMQSARAGAISPFSSAATSLLGSAATISSKWLDRTPTAPGATSIWSKG